MTSRARGAPGTSECPSRVLPIAASRLRGSRGAYDETYRREPAGWRIHRLNANIQIMSPYEDGWAQAPMMG